MDFAGCVLKKFVCNLQSFNKIKKSPSQVTDYHCDPDGARTHDPQLRRLLLYPTELLDLIEAAKIDVFLFLASLNS